MRPRLDSCLSFGSRSRPLPKARSNRLAHGRFRLRHRLAAIAGCLLLVAAGAHGQQSVEGFRIAPGVLIDAANDVAFLMSPKGQVQAVKLEKGEILWTSSAAARPIALRGERIIAQVEAGEADAILTLVALAAADGKPAGPAQKIDLGTGVRTSIDDGVENQFVVGTREADARRGPILWRYFEQKLSGPEEDPASPFERFGALDVSDTASISRLSNGGTDRKSGRPPYAAPRISRPGSEVPKAETVILDLETGARYRPDGVSVPSNGGGTTAPPGDAAKAVPIKPPTGGLIITEGGHDEKAPPTRRIPGDQFAYSVDDRHLAASAFAGVIEAAEPYRWTVYERGTFEIAAQFMAQTSLAPFILTGGRVLYLQQPFQRRVGGQLKNHPLALVARDARTGRIVWTRTVRDTRYQGPIPSQPR